MGLLTAYLAYRSGRRRAERKAQREQWELEEAAAHDVCDNCGYLREQHDDAGRCPTYR